MWITDTYSEGCHVNVHGLCEFLSVKLGTQSINRRQLFNNTESKSDGGKERETCKLPLDLCSWVFVFSVFLVHFSLAWPGSCLDPQSRFVGSSILPLVSFFLSLSPSLAQVA